MSYSSKLNKLEKWILSRIFKKICKQGGFHSNGITDFYSVIEKVIRTEFKEVDTVTMDHYINEWFFRGRMSVEPCNSCINRELLFASCMKCIQHERKFFNKLKIDFTEDEERIIT